MSGDGGGEVKEDEDERKKRELRVYGGTKGKGGHEGGYGLNIMIATTRINPLVAMVAVKGREL